MPQSFQQREEEEACGSSVHPLVSTHRQYADCFFCNREEQERKQQQELEEFRKNKTREFVPDPDPDMDSDDDEPDLLFRQRLAAALISFISGQLQSSLLRVCLHTLRILSRDSRGLAPMATYRALITLAGLGGIRLHLPCQQQQETTADDSGRTCCQTTEDATPLVACATGTHSSDQACCNGGNGGGKKDIWEEKEEEMDEDEKMCQKEAMKALCNVIYNSPRAQERAAELRLLQGVWESVKIDINRREQGTGQFYRLRLLFLLTALRPELRLQLWQEQGVSVLTKALERCLAVRWAEGYEVLSDVTGAPVSTEIAQEVIEILKTLFNITHKFNRQEPDEEDAAQYRHLAAVLRHCLLLSYDGEDTSEDIQRHTVNILSALPLKCLDVLLSAHAHKASHEWEGVNMDCVHTLLCFMERRLTRGDKLKEKLIPVLNLLTESSRVHRETRHYLRQKILPPLRDVAIRPEQDPTVRGQLVRLMTHVDTDVKHCAAELLFVLCKENVSRFVKYTGYGNAAGLLAARGLLSGRRNSGDFQYASQYSSDSDSDTEEYREAKARINLVTGRVEAEQPDPMEGMTEEEKEEEACRLISMINRLSQNQIIQPVGVTVDGRFAPLCNQISGCTLQEDDEGEEENMDMMPEGTDEDKRME
ncbi:synembryn-A isoform X2 [Dunckerocampus dactyliophorus]|uniref:synembryn-A isoform X2 n=1 Tax=Dunckerocampus dactyliophorus TaxID=161453 RepID=UPI0024054327|nr:synembryn-A isoform X2 [Dunckerocampus dactyliophorus]